MTCTFRTSLRDGFPALPGLRRDLRDWAQAAGIDAGQTEDLVIAVNELATNALEAASDGEAEVEGEAGPDEVRITVSNQGPPFTWTPPVTPEPPGPGSTRGRGLHIAAALVDRLSISAANGCTEAFLALHRA